MEIKENNNKTIKFETLTEGTIFKMSRGGIYYCTTDYYLKIKRSVDKNAVNLDGNNLARFDDDADVIIIDAILVIK